MFDVFFSLKYFIGTDIIKTINVYNIRMLNSLLYQNIFYKFKLLFTENIENQIVV